MSSDTMRTFERRSVRVDGQEESARGRLAPVHEHDDRHPRGGDVLDHLLHRGDQPPGRVELEDHEPGVRLVRPLYRLLQVARGDGVQGVVQGDRIDQPFGRLGRGGIRRRRGPGDDEGEKRERQKGTTRAPHASRAPRSWSRRPAPSRIRSSASAYDILTYPGAPKASPGTVATPISVIRRRANSIEVAQPSAAMAPLTLGNT